MHECVPLCEHSAGILLEKPAPAKPRLRLTTPVTRLWNLPAIERDPELLSAPEHFDVRWDILIDCDTLGLDPSLTHHESSVPFARVRNVLVPRTGERHGEDLYNSLMEEMAGDEWHFGFADDSVPEPGVFRALRDAIAIGSEAVVFPMRPEENHFCEAHEDRLHPSVVSGGQLAFKRKILGNVRWKPGNPCLDGVFIRDLWLATRHTATWRYLEAPILHHNTLPRARP